MFQIIILFKYLSVNRTFGCDRRVLVKFLRLLLALFRILLLLFYYIVYYIRYYLQIHLNRDNSAPRYPNSILQKVALVLFCCRQKIIFPHRVHFNTSVLYLAIKVIDIKFRHVPSSILFKSFSFQSLTLFELEILKLFSSS